MYQKAPIVRKYSVFKVRGGAAQRPVAYITVRGWVIGTGRVDKLLPVFLVAGGQREKWCHVVTEG